MPTRPRPTLPRKRSQRAMLLLTIAVAYAAVATATAPWTLYSRIFTAIPIVVAIGYALARGWQRRGADTPRVQVDLAAVSGLMIWSVLFTLLAVWILLVFFSHPRSDYPTLSYLMDNAFHNYPLRVAGFAAWLGAGWYIFRR